MTRLSGHAYPWDVLGDPDFPGRVLDLGIGDVTLASAYHAVRAATPLHPHHQVVTAPTSALYRPVRPEVWSGYRLAPVPPSWPDVPDPFKAATRLLTPAGLGVTAWVVLTHNSRLGQSCPDIAVVNCFGDRYSHALCPHWPEVRRYAAALAAEAVHDADVSGVLLEAWGQQGVAHGSMHDKTAGAWSPTATRLLSVCCCVACRTAWASRGLDSQQVVTALRDAVRIDSDIPEDVADEICGVRSAAAAELLTEVLDALPDLPVTVFTDPDPWAAAPVTAIDSRVTTAVVSAWSTDPARAQAVTAARKVLPSTMTIGAYVTVLPPVEPIAVPAHVARLLTAGAQQLNLYHLGLAGADRQRALRAATEVEVTFDGHTG